MADTPILPDGWTVAQIGQVSQINPKHPKETDDSTKVSFVPMASVSDVLGEIVSHEERDFGKVRKGYTHFGDDDVLFAKITPCMENGKSAVVTGMTNGMACGSTEFYVFRPAGVLPGFLHRYLRQVSFRQEAERHMTGAVGQRRVPKKYLESYEIPVPPLNEQRRIADKIDALQAKSRRAREALETVGPLLEKFRQSVLAAAFRGDLTAEWRKQHPDVEPAVSAIDELINSGQQIKLRRGVPESVLMPEAFNEIDLPETWCLLSVADLLRKRALIDIKDGNHGANHPKKDEFSADGLPFITAAQVTSESIDYDGAPKVSGEPLAKMKVGFAEPNDVVFTHKGTVGRVAIADRKCVLSPQTTYYRVEKKVFLEEYLMYFMASYLFSMQYEPIMSQTTRNFVPIKTQYTLFIAIPPIEEQAIIVDVVRKHCATIHEISRKCATQLQSTDHLDQSILAKAFRGELVPQDPNDEPASVLLERIKAEQEASKGKKKTRRKA